MFKKRGLYVLLLILLSLSVIAQENVPYHLKLLAVQEDGDVIEGSDADVFLELKKGSGRVFLETFPLTKLDTQISTRFAKDTACNEFKLDCDKYDFIFTIKAKSNIIAGPSAGAAIAALTTIAILDLEHDETVAITGTINSGGLIGPVGGVKEKLEAAAASELRKVLISSGAGKVNVSINNETKTTLEYAEENLGLEVIEVMGLDEVIFEMTGINLNHQEVTVIENVEYTQIMQRLQEQLCLRSDELETEIENRNIEFSNSTAELISQRSGTADNASKMGDYYSAASYCFSNNILLQTEIYKEEALSVVEINDEFSKLEIETYNLEKEIEKEEINTISDLQTFMIVKERLNDVKNQIKIYDEGEQTLENSYGLLGFAKERFFSAQAWKEFFIMEGREFVLDEVILENSCMRKISESEERLQYANLYLPVPSDVIKEKIDTAKAALNDKEFALCLITAAQAKADSSAILSSLGLTDDIANEFLNGKRAAAERIIAANSEEGVFPILGYSYYQYANSLREEPFTSLVYLEYALEMSELSIYFPEKKKSLPINYQVKEEWIIFVVGLLLGIVITLMIQERGHNNLTKKRKY